MDSNEIELNSANDQASHNKKQFVIGLLVGILFMSALCLIVVMCVVKHYTKTVSGSSGYISSSESVLDRTTVAKLERIQALFKKNSIYDQDIDKMRRGIIDGLMYGTGDRYAQYYSREELTTLFSDYGGKIYGIGATLALNEAGYPEIQKVYEDSPAERAGLRAYDIITMVDGVDILGMSLDESVQLIRGDKGTQVVLTVYREEELDYLEITAVRDEVNVAVVESDLFDGNIGYIIISSWYDTTPGQFEKKLKELKEKGIESLIIDLRGNTGGLLTSVVDTSRLVLPKGCVVYTENVNGKNSYYDCDGKNEIQIPVVILTDAHTASASEIFTAAMKDHGKAISMGTNTYGKGVVQTFEYFEDGSGMKYTAEQYFTPNGTAIDGVGIAPDIEVLFDPVAYYDTENPLDNQLEAAKEYLLTGTYSGEGK